MYRPASRTLPNYSMVWLTLSKPMRSMASTRCSSYSAGKFVVLPTAGVAEHSFTGISNLAFRKLKIYTHLGGDEHIFSISIPRQRRGFRM